MTFSQNPWKHWQIEKLCATMLPKSQKQRSSAMSLAVVTLKKGEGRLLKSGGMWIFDNEVASIMVRRQDFSWIRNTIVWQSRSFAGMPEFWTVLPIPVLSP